MIYIDSYDTEMLVIIRRNPGISQSDLRKIVGRPTPFRKRMKRLTELGLIKQQIDNANSPQTERKLYLNKKIFKETVCI